MKRKTKEPEPNNNDGLEKFIVERIKFLKKIKKHSEGKKQKRILKHVILGLEYLLFKWKEIK